MISRFSRLINPIISYYPNKKMLDTNYNDALVLMKYKGESTSANINNPGGSDESELIFIIGIVTASIIINNIKK